MKSKEKIMICGLTLIAIILTGSAVGFSVSLLSNNNDIQPFDNASKKEKAKIIQQHLQEMSEHLRMVTVLVLMQDFAQKEAAKILNRSEPSISRDLDNAKNWLRNRLKNLI